MARRRRKLKTTPLDNQPRSQKDSEALLEKVFGYLERKQPEQALAVLDELPPGIMRRAEALYARGHAHQLLDDHYSAIEDLENALLRDPGIVTAYIFLAISYASLEFWGHARQAAQRYLKRSPAGAEGEEIAQEILSTAQERIAHKASVANIPVQTFERAIMPHERTQRFLASGNFRRSLAESETAIRLAPDLVSAHNNRVLALFYLGRIEEAIKEAIKILNTLDADNVHALSNLIMLHLCRWQREEAAVYAGRLKNFLLSSTLENIDLEKAIEGMGIWEDDETLWDIAQRVIDEPPWVLPGNYWYLLGAAAANTGHLNEAERLLDRALKQPYGREERIKEALKSVRKAKRKREPAEGPSLTGRFPYIHFSLFWDLNLAEELFENLSKADQDEPIGRHLKQYMKQYPAVALACQLILWQERDERLRDMAVDLLAATGHPQALQEILNFAASQYGSDDQRMNALRALQEAGRLGSSEKIRFWSEKDGEWRDIVLYYSQIEEQYFSPCDAKALIWVDKSNRALAKDDSEKGRSEAAAYLKKALEIDPNCAIAIHNLGAIYLYRGNTEEGEALIHRSVEVDPEYLFGYLTLAGLEFQRKNYQESKDIIQRILSAPSIPLNVMEGVLALQVHLAVSENLAEEAETALETLKTISPEYNRLEELESIVRLINLEKIFRTRWSENAHRYQERMLSRPISADESLAYCLDRLTKEVLVRSLRSWGLSTMGRKAELVARLEEAMRDRRSLEDFVKDWLTKEEQEAMAWVLKAGGIRAWEEFSDRFGDDAGESPYWQYHEPNTISGRLRFSGLLAVGTFEGRRVALIPHELRPLLSEMILVEEG